MKFTKSLGFLLLGIWLIVTRLIPLFHLSFSGLGTIMAVLAIATEALILLGRETIQESRKIQCLL